ncbi:MAG: CoB--CoM heterodisulfide reductase iron-sulfur subunit B family protein [Candidatus Helarchaeota archaeon]
MDYAYFLGCTVPARTNQYDAATRKVAEKLGIGLNDIEGASCCGLNFKYLDRKAWLLMAARNIVLAERMNMNIMTLCNGCYETLKEVNHELKLHDSLRQDMNKTLQKVGLEFQGTIEILHLVDVLAGLDKELIRSKFSISLKGLKVAVHYGCHLLKPSRIIQFDDPENPHVLDDLVELTGAKAVAWDDKLTCCGGPLLSVNEDLSVRLALDKFKGAHSAGADILLSVCPFCTIQFDLIQLKVQEKYNLDFEIPVIFLPQLYGLAMGMDPDELGVELHRIPLEDVIESIQEATTE